MSSDNQLQMQTEKSTQISQYHDESKDQDLSNVYKNATILIVSLIYIIYISPLMIDRSYAAETTGMKATYRWVDLLTKLVLVYLLAYAVTCSVSVSIVVTLVFLLFATQDYDRVIEPKKNVKNMKNKKNKKNEKNMKNMIEKMTGDEEDLDEVDDEDSTIYESKESAMGSDFMFKRKGGDFIYDSNTKVLFPLNGGSMDEDMVDQLGDVYSKPQTVKGLIVDTVAESEKIANIQGLGMNIDENI